MSEYPRVQQTSSQEDTGMIPDDPLTGHSYDGIQEFDNPLPGWWKWLFVGIDLLCTSLLHVLPRRCRGSNDRTIATTVRWQQTCELQFAEIGELQPNRETVVEFLYKPNWLQVGKTVFKANCVSCHGHDGGGQIGPNLCDDSYKNVKDIGDILTVLQNGANAGAMPAWKTRMSAKRIDPDRQLRRKSAWNRTGNRQGSEGRMIAAWPEAPPEVEYEARSRRRGDW